MLLELAPWVTLIVGVFLLLDDLVVAPARRLDPTREVPPAIRVLRWVLVFAVAATLAAIFRSQSVDFSLLLVVATAVTGLIWLVDRVMLRPRRRRLAAAAGAKVPEGALDPVSVEYARSFFPVILLVLVIRSFIFEPFRIPSDSMMPTLLRGDFIFVNKFAYGLRLPVLNEKIVETGTPKRGDVVVFRKPSEPNTNYIKRLVGLPGDEIRVEQRRVYVNGQLVPMNIVGIYQGHGHDQARLGVEVLDGVQHQVLFRPWQPQLTNEPFHVPEGHYFFMGDNRDNSQDSRFPDVGYVPEANLVGRAVRIWLNWKWGDWPIWSRIGDKIE